MSTDLLVLIYDVNPLPWSSTTTPYTFTTVTEQLLVYINTFHLLNKHNKFVMILCSHYQVKYIYPMHTANNNTHNHNEQLYDTDSKSTEPNDAFDNNNKDNKKNAMDDSDVNYMNIHHILKQQIYRFIAEQHNDITSNSTHVESNTTLLSGALSLAMCYINKQRLQNNKIKSRIMCVMSSHDSNGQYVPVMNTVFEAQKLNVYIDSLILTHHIVQSNTNTHGNKKSIPASDSIVYDGNDSRLMQQASHITNGVYYRPLINNKSDTNTLLQYLYTMYLPDSISRTQLILPTLTTVDYRASCFCHNQPIELAFVCPVCLAVWCKNMLQCQVCKTKFSAITRTANKT